MGQLGRRTSERVVKLCADRGPTVEPGSRYVLSSGFLVRPGVILTSRHGLRDAEDIDVTQMRVGTQRVTVTESSVVHAPGYEADEGPDVAILRAPGLGEGIPDYPIGLVRRDVGLARLDVDVAGFPAFMKTELLRSPFHGAGAISLLANFERGLIDVVLDAAPIPLHPDADLGSQWLGISGSPVVAEGRLVGIITEHNWAAGTSNLTGTPLSLSWPDVSKPSLEQLEWWRLLGVTNWDYVTWLPAMVGFSSYVEAIQALRETLRYSTVLPPQMRNPLHFGEGLQRMLRESFERADYDLETALGNALASLDSLALDSDELRYSVQFCQPVRGHQLTELLDQLLSVQTEANQHLGLHAARLRYRVGTPTLDADEHHSELARWREAVHDEGREDLAQRIVFDTGRDELGRLLATLSEPAWGIDNPHSFAKDLVDCVINESLGSEQALDNLTRRTHVRLEVRGVLLTAADRLPDAVERDDKGFLMNEQPTLEHLRQGDVARLEELDHIEDTYWKWYAAYVAKGRHSGGRIPMFWLVGPSGAGKSVALVQLLAILGSRGGVTAIKWDEPATGLSEVIRHARSVGSGRHVIIAVDDPRATDSPGLDSPWRTAFAELWDLRQSGDVSSMPIFLCCSPSDQYATFLRTYGADIHTGTFEVDPYRPGFIENLRRWYEERTGRLTNVELGDHQLPVQLFFEWWKGESLSTFATHFRQRTSAAGLTSFFDRLLALNRLYVGYPLASTRLLPPGGLDALSSFVSDMHVSDSANSRPGYWFAHPHLANVIYEGWHDPESSKHKRASDVSEAIVDASRVPEDRWRASLPTLNRLLDLATTDAESEPERRLSFDEIQLALDSALRELRPDVESCADNVLAAWVRLEQVLSPLPAWSPRGEALDRLGSAEEVDFRLVAELATLEDSEVEDAVWGWLTRRTEWSGWFQIAVRLVQHRLSPNWVDAILAQIDAHPDWKARIDLTTELLSRTPRAQVVAERLLLEDPRKDASLLPLARKLRQLGPQCDAGLLEWLGRRRLPDDGLLYADYFARPQYSAMLQSLAIGWAIRFPTREGAPAIFARSLSWLRIQDAEYRKALGRHLEHAAASIDPALWRQITRLLTDNHQDWSFLFCALSPAQILLPEMLSRALDWLGLAAHQPSWHRVFYALAQASLEPSDPLVDHLLSHLARQECVFSDSFIILATLKCTPSDRLEDVVNAARDWVRAQPNDIEGGGLVLQGLLRTMPPEWVPDHTVEIMTWWRRHRDADTGVPAHLVARLAQVAPEPELTPILTELEEWLAERRQYWSTAFVGWAERAPGTGVARLGLPWLRANLFDARWAAVLTCALPHLAKADVEDLVTEWLVAQTNSDGTVGYVWRIAIEEGPCPDLLSQERFRDAVRQWLSSNTAQKSWWHIFRQSLLADPHDAPMLAIALQGDDFGPRAFGIANLLARVADAHGPVMHEKIMEVLARSPRTETRNVVWMYLVSKAPTEAAWQVGLEGLADATPERFSGQWRRMWNLYDEPSRRSILRDRARTWLQTNADSDAAVKVLAKLADDPAWKINPATVFGNRRR